jgi:phenylacetate-CoA ligase
MTFREPAGALGAAASRARLQRLIAARVAGEVEKLNWPRERLLDLRDLRLKSLVAHAKAHSPWHRRRLAHLDIDTFGYESLRDIAPMTKHDLMSNWDEVVTDRRLTLAAAEQHLGRVERDGHDLLFGEYIVVATGGTTGESAVVAWSDGAFVDAVLANLRHARWQEAGLPRPLRRIALLYAESPVHFTSMASWMMPSSGSDVRVFAPTLPLRTVVAGLNEFQPDGVSGYASMVALLAREADEGRLHIAPVAFQASGERLHPVWREKVEKAFGVPVFESYGATEMGPAAVSDPPRPGLHLFEDTVLLEPVDERGRPVPDGASSDRVLMTNLVNTAMPLIRYELTDRIAFDPDPLAGVFPGRRISRIDGRTLDVLEFSGGRRMHFVAFESLLVRTPGRVDARAHQHGDHLTVTAVPTAGFDGDALAERLRGALAEHGIPDAVVAVATATALPRDPRSGKAARRLTQESP